MATNWHLLYVITARLVDHLVCCGELQQLPSRQAGRLDRGVQEGDRQSLPHVDQEWPAADRRQRGHRHGYRGAIHLPERLVQPAQPGKVG
jgi:hypothetical protein